MTARSVPALMSDAAARTRTPFAGTDGAGAVATDSSPVLKFWTTILTPRFPADPPSRPARLGCEPLEPQLEHDDGEEPLQRQEAGSSRCSLRSRDPLRLEEAAPVDPSGVERAAEEIAHPRPVHIGLERRVEGLLGAARHRLRQ